MTLLIDGYEVANAEFIAGLWPCIRGYYKPAGEFLPYELGDFNLERHQWEVCW